ncbi:MAG: toll/interleukin-1 receptor domain-containing protein, partial [Blastocatellia bacterium]
MFDHEYDLFLSHASEDKVWCEMLAERLRNASIRVWFDGWELQPGDHLLARLNEGLKRSRKMVAVWSANYFRDDKTWTLAEGFSQQHKSVLASDRPLIPLLIEDCDVPPTFLNLVQLDFRNPDDFELRLRQLIEALD